MQPRPKRFIPAIMPYPPGKPIEEVQREFGLDSVIKLASNENPLGPSRKAIRAMQEAAAEMHLYPDGFGYYLKQELARRHRLPVEYFCLTNGSDEVTDLIANAYLSPNSRVVFSEHDFISYKLGAMMAGSRFVEVPLQNWRVDLRGLLAAIDDKTRLICIANPTNPVGSMVEKDEWEDFIARVPENVLVLLDEAYAEYVTTRKYPNGMRYVKEHPNLVVGRTFSKAYGLAGLRLGYAAAHPEIIRNFDRVRPPFNASRMAQKAGLAALGDEAHVKRTRELNKRGMAQLEKGFKALGLDWVPSYANFILVDTRRPGDKMMQSLLPQGVIARPVGLYGLPTHLRVTVGKASENRRFLAALKRALKEVEPQA